MLYNNGIRLIKWISQTKKEKQIMLIQFKNKQGEFINIETLAHDTFAYSFKSKHLILFAKGKLAFKSLNKLKNTDILITPTENPYLDNKPFCPKTFEVR